MMCELNTDPNLYPESSSDTEQDWLAGEEIPQMLETFKVTLQNLKPLIKIAQLKNIHIFSTLLAVYQLIIVNLKEIPVSSVA